MAFLVDVSMSPSLHWTEEMYKCMAGRFDINIDDTHEDDTKLL